MTATAVTNGIAPQNRAILSTTNDRAWNGFYQAGATAALFTVLIGLLDTIIMFLPGGATAAPGTLTVTQWFALFQANPFLGLRALGLLNVITNALGVVVLLALYGAQRRINPPGAALAVILVCMGASIYIANNVALPMLALSGDYATASASERAALAAAGQALLVREDLTAGAFLGFFFTEVAQITMAIVMLRSGTVGKWTAWAGLLGFGCLLLFNISAAFAPALYDLALLLALVAAILVLAYYLLIARTLFHLSQPRMPGEAH